MKAAVHDEYGPPDKVLRVREINRPVPGDGEVLVRVRAASMHPDIWHAVTGLPYASRLMSGGLRRPRVTIPGTDLAGEVVSIGTNVSRFKVGDPVFGEGVMKTLPGTELAIGSGRTFAEYAVAGEASLAHKPQNITFEQAAVVPTSGYVALCALGSEDRLRGQHVLINGAGGCVGSLAVQIAKGGGARVTGVDRAEKLSMLGSLGADLAIDYSRADVLHREERYDLILDVPGTLSLVDTVRVLTATGTYCQIGHGHYGKIGGRIFGAISGGSIPRTLAVAARVVTNRHFSTVKFNLFSKSRALTTLRALLESQQLAPIVARAFSLDQVPAALRCLEEGRAPGRIVVTP
jgi:NADPH:quinone reductase-like Zn-dependent oxidoreductase